jgi:hypothetical protein
MQWAGEAVGQLAARKASEASWATAGPRGERAGPA